MSIYSKISPEFIEKLITIVGKQHCLVDKKALMPYGSDKTEDYFFEPEVVLKPGSPEEISDILKLCNEHRVPVTPRGAGTGLSGGALPIHHGIVLAMERFNRILSIDELNLQATVEPGVITQTLQEAVKEKGLFYPPDPASKGSCFIGGNLAENSGGPKAVKYGVTRDYVLNLEVVLPTGEIIWTGANVLKYATGYNLTQLMIGSEGTLGIITKVVFKLKPYPQKDVTLLCPFITSEEACKAISAIYMAGIVPSGMEFLEKDAIQKTKAYLEQELHEKITFEIPDEMGALLLMELDGNNEDMLMLEAERIATAIEPFETGELLFADSTAQKDELWKIRRNVSPAVNAHTVTKSEDVVVPRGQLPQLVKAIKAIGETYGFESVCFGHAGDGNLHINILKNDISEEDWHGKINEGIGMIFKTVASLGGTLSGEHGIGLAKRDYMHLVMSEAHFRIMRGIKQTFDPNHILNPDKIFKVR